MASNCPAYDELMNTLYSPVARETIEFVIGAALEGEVNPDHNLVMLHGPAGSGKSTMLYIIQKLFAKRYWIVGESFSVPALFDGKAGVAVCHDCDATHLERYLFPSNMWTFAATNRDAPTRYENNYDMVSKRAIDIQQSGSRLPLKGYLLVMEQIDSELDGIAERCRAVYVKNRKDGWDEEFRTY